MHVPWSEGVKAVEENDNGEVYDRAPRKIRLEWRLIWQGISVDSLLLQSFVELYVGNADGDPGQHCDQCREVAQPNEYLGRSCSAAEVC